MRYIWRIIIKHKHYGAHKKVRRGLTNMNANTIISDDMTLDEKLAAIDAAMANMVATAQKTGAAPIDPAEALMCEGCQ